MSLDSNFGNQIRTCELKVDNTAMLEALRKRLASISNGEVVRFNHVLAEATVENEGVGKIRSQGENYELSPDMNQSQRAAVAIGLGNSVSYVWGPPGTGKTKTLTELIRVLFDREKRILICSNTNQAVDQVLLKLCQSMGTSHPGVEDGKIVRMGRIAHEQLDEEWSPYVTVAGIVERKAVELRARLRELEMQAVPLQRELDKIDRILSSLDRIEQARKEQREAVSRGKQAENEIREAEQLLVSLAGDKKALEDELGKFEAAGTIRRMIFLRPEKAIRGDLDQLTKRRNETEQQIPVSQGIVSEALAFEQKIRNRITEMQRSIPPGLGTRKDLEHKRDALENRIQPLHREIASINKKLADMESEVIQSARIVAATVTKTYLTPSAIYRFRYRDRR